MNDVAAGNVPRGANGAKVHSAISAKCIGSTHVPYATTSGASYFLDRW